MTRRKRILIAAILGLYCLGYAVVRTQYMIVHTSMGAGDEYTLHDVVAGDAKLASPNMLIAAFYTPMCYLERACWYLVKPVGSRYP